MLDGPDGKNLHLTREKCVEQINLLERQKRGIELALSELRQIYTSFYRTLLEDQDDLLKAALGFQNGAGPVWQQYARQAAVKPPSTTNSAPVVKAEFVARQKHDMRATSIGSASRPSGAALSTLACIFCGSRALSTIDWSSGVSTNDGCTELQRML